MRIIFSPVSIDLYYSRNEIPDIETNPLISRDVRETKRKLEDVRERERARIYEKKARYRMYTYMLIRDTRERRKNSRVLAHEKVRNGN